MKQSKFGARAGALATGASLVAMLVASGLGGSNTARADDDDHFFFGLLPGNLLVSRSVYDNKAATISVGTTLPPNCTTGCAKAIADGTYPTVFNNDTVDGSFGITSKIFLDQLTTSGKFINSLEVPNSTDRHIGPNSDQMVTSFSSKSEIGLNLSTDGEVVTFMGYFAPVDAIDVSNSNTPLETDSTNPVNEAFYRVVAELDASGHFRFTKTNAYSGNNGRAAISAPGPSHSRLFYTSGNAGNGSNPQPNGIIIGAGTQIITDADKPLVAQTPSDPTPVGSFNVTQLTDAADKIGKDTNFRGLTIFNNVVYTTKGSGGNGINTVYFIDTSGFNSAGEPLACPTTGTPTPATPGVGLPSPTATLPTAGIPFSAALLQTKGVTPYNMCVLKGFNTTLASKKSNTAFPFGVWFANANTLYVADEGNGTNTFSTTSSTYTAAAAQTTAGLQKWVLSNGTWTLAYVLQSGLQLGTPYTVAGYPTGNNPATSLPWSPATDGLRNLTGRVNRDGTVTIWAVTSTVSGSGDQGADPNKLVAITDNLSATTLPAGESFVTVDSARFAEVLRGVSFTPGTHGDCDRDDDDHRFGDDDRRFGDDDDHRCDRH
jgi:hypothetical protein